MEKNLYFNKLDALRFVAFFFVFWQHGFANSFINLSTNPVVKTIIEKLTITGGMGVHIFFVISGFLITYLMIKEENKTGKVNLPFFYVRRILRIWPLYYLIVITGIFILPHLINTLKFEGNPLLNLTFLNNFDPNKDSAHISIAWSVAIEEQFYLVWPVLFILFKNKRALFALSFALFAASCSYVIIGRGTYFHTFGNIKFLMMGCMGAIVYAHREGAIKNYLLSKTWLLYAAILTAALLVVLSGFSRPVEIAASVILPGLYLYVILNAVAYSDGSETSYTSKLGKYTYGMYLYHPLIIIFTRVGFDILHLNYNTSSAINAIVGLIALAVTIVVSIISYEYFEKHILSYKNKFSFVKTRI